MSLEYKVVNLRYEMEAAEQHNLRSLDIYGWGNFVAVEPETDLLAKMGNDGWKLCAVHGSKYYFHRTRVSSNG